MWLIMQPRVSWFALAVSVMASAATSVQLTDVHYSSGHRGSRVILELGASAEYQVHQLENPSRLYVDLVNVRLSRRLQATPSIPVNGSAVMQVRVANRPGGARVVLDLASSARQNISLLSNPPRLVIDFPVNPPAALAMERITGTASIPDPTDLPAPPQLQARLQAIAPALYPASFQFAAPVIEEAPQVAQRASLTSYAGDAALSGTVLDPNGAAVVGVPVVLNGSGQHLSAVTNSVGDFMFKAVPAGNYEVSVRQEGFQQSKTRVTITRSGRRNLEIKLALAARHDEMTVSGTGVQVNTDPDGNLDVIHLERTMLSSLPILGGDVLGALAALLDQSAVGTGGGSIVVDGVEQSKRNIPPSSIREVRINQNPYSAEYSRPGRGRIEVITNSGTSDFHGGFDVLLRDYRLDARNPLATERPHDQHRTYEGNLSGPLSKDRKTTFAFSLWREEQDLVAVIYAVGPSGLIRQNFPNPARSNTFSSKVTRNFTETNSITLGYDYYARTSSGDSLGEINTADVATATTTRSQLFSFTQKVFIRPKLISEFLLKAGKTDTETNSRIPDVPKVVVLDSFVGGGAQAALHFTETQVQLNEVLSWSHGKHFIKGGVNVPNFNREESTDRSNFQGTFFFSSLNDYLNKTPYSFVIQQGDPRLSFWQKDIGLFVQDDIRIRPNFSMGVGLRYDRQNYLSDNNNVAPRVSFAFAPGMDRKTVLRTGAGIFYDRTGTRPISDLLYYNGSHLQQTTVTNGGYPDPFLAAGGLSVQPPNLVRFAPNLLSPYLAVYSFGVDRQLTKTTSLSVNYIGTRGIKMFRSRNLNAPYGPLFAIPDPSIGVLRQIESSGHLESHSVRVSLRGSIGKFFSGSVNYIWSHTNDNTSGISSFPADNYDLSGQWSRSDLDQRHRLYSFGTFTLPHNFFNLGVIFSATSGSPYSLITGRDDNHDTFATDRPVGVPRNSLVGPDYFQLDARWSRRFLLHETKKGEGPSATIGFDAFNVLNHVNYQTIVGDLSSPLFGRPVSTKWPRRMQISLGLAF